MIRKLLSKLWADEGGFIISTELLFVAVILVIGLVAGWSMVQTAVLNELTSLATAITALDASYSNPGYTTTGGAGGSDPSSYAYTPTTPVLVPVTGGTLPGSQPLTWTAIAP